MSGRSRSVRYQGRDRKIRRAKIVALYTEEKWSLEAIGRELNMSSSTVSSFLRDANVPTRPRGSTVIGSGIKSVKETHPHLADKDEKELHQQARQMYEAQGLSCEKIGKLMGVSTSTAYRWVRASGATLRPALRDLIKEQQKAARAKAQEGASNGHQGAEQGDA